MNLDNNTITFGLIVYLTAREIVPLVARLIWKKTTFGTEYVTAKVCKARRAECNHGENKEVTEAINRMAAELLTLRKINVRHLLNSPALTGEDRKNLEALLSV